MGRGSLNGEKYESTSSSANSREEASSNSEEGNDSSEILYGRLIPRFRPRERKTVTDSHTGLELPSWWPPDLQPDLQRLELYSYYEDLEGYSGGQFISINCSQLPMEWKQTAKGGKKEPGLISTRSILQRKLNVLADNRPLAVSCPKVEITYDPQKKETQIVTEGGNDYYPGNKDTFRNSVRLEQLVAVEQLSLPGQWHYLNDPDWEEAALVYVGETEQILGWVNFGDYRDY